MDELRLLARLALPAQLPGPDQLRPARDRLLAAAAAEPAGSPTRLTAVAAPQQRPRRARPLPLTAALTGAAACGIAAALVLAPAAPIAGHRPAVVERARHHAELARRRYLAVDPDNRLVAQTLEADYNTALRDLRDAQDTYETAARHARDRLTDAQRARIHRLVTDLPAIWNDPTTPCGNANAWPGS
jgi:hypothetical protein